MRTLVLHYTAESLADSIASLTDPQKQVSSHYLVPDAANGGERFRIYSLAPESRRAWHAGVSYWQGERMLNASSVGIEVVNLGFPAQDGNAPLMNRRWYPYPDAQIAVVGRLAADIVARHAILPRKVVGHADIAPGRKLDPGPCSRGKRCMNSSGSAHGLKRKPSTIIKAISRSAATSPSCRRSCSPMATTRRRPACSTRKPSTLLPPSRCIFGPADTMARRISKPRRSSMLCWKNISAADDARSNARRCPDSAAPGVRKATICGPRQTRPGSRAHRPFKTGTASFWRTGRLDHHQPRFHGISGLNPRRASKPGEECARSSKSAEHAARKPLIQLGRGYGRWPVDTGQGLHQSIRRPSGSKNGCGPSNVPT